MAWVSFYAPLCVVKCQVKSVPRFPLDYYCNTMPNIFPFDSNAPWISFSELQTMLTFMCLSFYYNNSIWN